MVGKRTSKCLAVSILQRLDHIEASLALIASSCSSLDSAASISAAPGCWHPLVPSFGGCLRAEAPEFAPAFGTGAEQEEYADELFGDETPGTDNVFLDSASKKESDAGSSEFREPPIGPLREEGKKDEEAFGRKRLEPTDLHLVYTHTLAVLDEAVIREHPDWDDFFSWCSAGPVPYAKSPVNFRAYVEQDDAYQPDVDMDALVQKSEEEEGVEEEAEAEAEAEASSEAELAEASAMLDRQIVASLRLRLLLRRAGADDSQLGMWLDRAVELKKWGQADACLFRATSAKLLDLSGAALSQLEDGG